MDKKEQGGATEHEGDAERDEPNDVSLKSRISKIEILTFALSFTVAVASMVQLLGYISSERAIIFVESVSLPAGIAGVDPLPMQLAIQNGGKTVATVHNLALAITHELPSRPDYTAANRRALPPVVPEGSVKKTFTFEVAAGGYSEDIVRRLKDGSLRFYIYGVIRYSDWANFPSIFGYRETGFCFQYIRLGKENAFETCDNPAYSYAN